MSKYQDFKNRVLSANLQLVKCGLVILTWGNASEIDRLNGVIAIKPSGVDYAKMTAEDIVVVDMEGKVLEGKLNPSSDLPSHLELYKAFPEIGGIVHTHSTYATAIAQSGKGLPCYGTTHADYFYGEIPCTRELTAEEIAEEYERNSGLVIAECFQSRKLSPTATPAAFIKNHAPFAWGASAAKAVETALVLEEISKIAILTKQYNSDAAPASAALIDKHYYRKHGANAYYGQKENK